MSESPLGAPEAQDEPGESDSFDVADFVAPDFEPAQPRARSDGWTAKRQADFIQALAETACVAEACRAVGMSQRSAYALRARIDAVSFRNAWEKALDYGIRRLSDAVLSRAVHGVAVPVFYKGEQIGEKRQFNDRLAMFLLRYRDPLHYGKWLERGEYGGHPEGAALELGAAKLAVCEDAGLDATGMPRRFMRRLRELAAKARLYRAGSAPPVILRRLCRELRELPRRARPFPLPLHRRLRQVRCLNNVSCVTNTVAKRRELTIRWPKPLPPRQRRARRRPLATST